MADFYDRMRMNNVLSWVSDMVQFMDGKGITIPKERHEQVKAVKQALNNDVSGLVNTMLDFSMSAASVKFSVESSNDNLEKTLNKWLVSVNSSLRGKVPVGIDALAKEYYRERWKGSSFIILRTVWEEVDGYKLPTKLWFVDGGTIGVDKETKDGIKRIGDEKYYIFRITREGNKVKALKIPSREDEKIFVQKPFNSWVDFDVTPYVIIKGIYKNLKMLELLVKKGEDVISKALEYLLLMKKGTEGLALNGSPEFVYSESDLTKVKDDLKNILNARGNTKGTPLYATNFDTDIEHLIPEYAKILKQELYTPIERRILAGLGLIEVIEGLASDRKESILNPKPFVSEIKAGINDFKSILSDILTTIAEENKTKHKKYFSSPNSFMTVYNTPIKEFMSREILQIIRSVYDRGALSKRTFLELAGDFDFDAEKDRRRQESEDGTEVLMYPPVTQNQEGSQPTLRPTTTVDTDETKQKDNVIPKDNEEENKSGPEKKDFTQSSVDAEVYNKNKDLPEEIKELPLRAQTIWRKTFNSIAGESTPITAMEVAWSTVKKVYKNTGLEWIKKEQAEIEESLKELEVSELLEMKKMEILGKKSKLLDKLLKEENLNENS